MRVLVPLLPEEVGRAAAWTPRPAGQPTRRYRASCPCRGDAYAHRNGDHGPWPAIASEPCYLVDIAALAGDAASDFAPTS